MTWLDCDTALVEVNWHSKKLGWERYEAILMKVRAELEARSGRPMRFRPGRVVRTLIRARTMKLFARLRRELFKARCDMEEEAAEQFFAHLHAQIHEWLSDALGHAP
jgi:hypothetical protein